MAAKRWDANLKGTNINDLLDIGPDVVGRLTRSELSKVVSRLSSAANKRLRRMEAQGLNMYGDRPFGSKGKDLPQLRTEYKRLVGFFERKAYNSVRSAKSFRKRTVETLVEETGIDPSTITDPDLTRFFGIYKRIADNGMLSQLGLAFRPSKTAMRKIFEWYVRQGKVPFSDFVTWAEEQARQEYEEGEDDADDGGVSQWFDL